MWDSNPVLSHATGFQDRLPTIGGIFPNLEATIRIELMIEVLQTSALPLGYVALIGAESEIRTHTLQVLNLLSLPIGLLPLRPPPCYLGGGVFGLLSILNAITVMDAVYQQTQSADQRSNNDAYNDCWSAGVW